ncbi:MAG: hypothetical protein QNK37_28565 [Acidobacteriota bacterium]|nr:hypothetical protein [Acidobacteriota bacterium]
MESVSPDYIGLQVTYGPVHRRGRTYHYWFKNRQTPTGRKVTADKQLMRKVGSLVLKRLRTGYMVKRKCDPWCRHVVEKTLRRAHEPKRITNVKGPWRPGNARTPLFHSMPEENKAQLMFDFAVEQRPKPADRRQLSLDFD